MAQPEANPLRVGTYRRVADTIAGTIHEVARSGLWSQLERLSGTLDAAHLFPAGRGAWHVTALYSNTDRAHELGRSRDRVVIHFYDGDHREGQHGVVTETRGALIGRRVMQGGEAECRRHFGFG